MRRQMEAEGAAAPQLADDKYAPANHARPCCIASTDCVILPVRVCTCRPAPALAFCKRPRCSNDQRNGSATSLRGSEADQLHAACLSEVTRLAIPRPLTETHQLAERKQEEMEELRKAWGIEAGSEGQAFNRELQEQKKQARALLCKLV